MTNHITRLDEMKRSLRGPSLHQIRRAEQRRKRLTIAGSLPGLNRLTPWTRGLGDYARLLRWRLLTAEERPVDPYGTITQEQAADLIIRPDMNEYEAQHAYDLDPWHPLIHLALAGLEKDPIRADFLRRYSLDRLPNDLKLRQRAAELLRKQGKEDLAQELEVRGQ